MAYRLLKISDILNRMPGLLVPADIKKLYDGTYSTSETNTYDGSSYSENYYEGKYKDILVPARYAAKFAPACFRYDCGDPANNSTECLEMSGATSGITLYNRWPYKKEINVTVWESLTGPANFKFFKIRAGTTANTYTEMGSLTWSEINNSSTKQISINVGTSHSTSASLFTVYMGGMTGSRPMYYSDNVCSPGVWKFVVDAQQANFDPAGTFPSSAIMVTTDKFDFDGKVRVLSFREYVYRLNHISVYVRARSAQGAPTNKPGSAKGQWVYNGAVCTADSCDCDCDGYDNTCDADVV